MQSVKLEIALAKDIGNHLGESPTWVARERALYWINCEHAPELFRWSADRDSVERWPMPERIGGVIPRSDDACIVVLSTGLYHCSLESGRTERMLASPLPSHISLHEAGCDRTGHLWVGSINHRITMEDMTPGGGCLFRVERGQLVPIADGMSCSNGLAFSPDGQRVYHCDTPTGRIDYWEIDAQGRVGERRPFATIPRGEGMPDGATVDTEGAYWVAMFIAGTVRRYLPDGTLDREYPLPFAGPTKVAFGGPDMGTLYVTTARLDIPGLTQGTTSGHLYRFRPGFTGAPDTALDPATLAAS